jgi:hypothetical protein
MKTSLERFSKAIAWFGLFRLDSKMQKYAHKALIPTRLVQSEVPMSSICVD